MAPTFEYQETYPTAVHNSEERMHLTFAVPGLVSVVRCQVVLHVPASPTGDSLSTPALPERRLRPDKDYPQPIGLSQDVFTGERGKPHASEPLVMPPPMLATVPGESRDEAHPALGAATGVVGVPAAALRALAGQPHDRLTSPPARRRSARAVTSYLRLGRVEAAVTADQPAQLRLLRLICRGVATDPAMRVECDR